MKTHKSTIKLDYIKFKSINILWAAKIQLISRLSITFISKNVELCVMKSTSFKRCDEQKFLAILKHYNKNKY
jgi:hypothetical protein